MPEKLQKVIKNDRKYLIEDLANKHQEVVLMRLSGMSYFQIAEKSKFKIWTLRNMFCKTGICFLAYKELAKEQTGENLKLFKKLEKKFKEYAPEMLETLYRVGKYNWKAAESLLDRAGFSPIEKIEQKIEMKEAKEFKETVMGLREDARRIRKLSQSNSQRA